MKKSVLLLIVVALFCGSGNCNAQLLNSAKKFVAGKTGGYSEKEAVDAIKEALVKGTNEGVKLVSAKDGYLGNMEIKIPFPADAQIIEKKLRSMGFGKNVDQAVVAMNRAAEDAGKEAGPIFVTAITSMSVSDGVAIVTGPDDAATIYLKKSTTADLTVKFKPVIKNSLDKVYATKYWADLVKLYNKIPGAKKMNPDLLAYVTGKAIDGLFVMVAKEELKIRKDPASQTTALLKKVFGK